MSHFLVIVVGGDVDEQLATYDENEQVESYVVCQAAELPAMLKQHNKDHPQNQYNSVAEYAKEWHGHNIDEDGNARSTYNQNSKWDYYVIGGRWNGYFKLRNGQLANSCRKCEIDVSKDMIPFAYVKDGEWHERGKMGWWSIVSDEKAQKDWTSEFWEMFDRLPKKAILTAVDCHI